VPPVREFLASLREDGRRIADAARVEIDRRFPGTEADVFEEDARAMILRVAEEWKADLIVLGARGLGPVSSFLLGSVSVAVARHARASVLIVKGGADLLRGALLGIDGSAHARAAATFLAGLPLDARTTVQLAGVVEPPHFPVTTPGLLAGPLQKAITDITQERRAALEQALAATAASFMHVVKHVEQHVLVGHPADQLVRAASQPGVDLVVLGARGLGTIERLLLGSVSEAVLRHVDRSVLIVKGGHP